VKDLTKVPTWQLEVDPNQRPSEGTDHHHSTNRQMWLYNAREKETLCSVDGAQRLWSLLRAVAKRCILSLTFPDFDLTPIRNETPGYCELDLIIIAPVISWSPWRGFCGR